MPSFMPSKMPSFMPSKMPIAQLKSTDPGTSSWYQTRLKRKTHKLTTSDTHTHTSTR